MNSLTIYLPDTVASEIILKENLRTVGLLTENGRVIRESDGRAVDINNSTDLASLQTAYRNSRKQAADSVFWLQEEVF